MKKKREELKKKTMSLRIGTVDVETMTGKGREITDMMQRRGIDILCVQETRWEGSRVRYI